MGLEDRSRPRVLIVDDDPMFVRSLTRLLEAWEFPAPVGETDPRKARDRYRELSPHVVLLDMNFGAPGVDGLSVLTELVAEDRDGYPPVIVLTGEEDPARRLQALHAGARDFLSKSADPAEILSRVRNVAQACMFQRELLNQNAILEDRVRDRTRELEASQLEVVRRLAVAAEQRDPETGAHVIRMSMYCGQLGRMMGLEEALCELLLRASPLHDVGKIGIPDRILLKPGEFTPEEWVVMRTHTTIGAAILAGSSSPLVRMGHDIALTHHERWDGSGYPAGVAGEAIPLVGRIAAVSDVFDALTSDRCYKKAWPVDKASDEIRRGRGILFDPAIVDAFDLVLPDLIEIRETATGDWPAAWGAP